MRTKDGAAAAAGGRAQHQALSKVLARARRGGFPHERANEALLAWLVQHDVVTYQLLSATARQRPGR